MEVQLFPSPPIWGCRLIARTADPKGKKKTYLVFTVLYTKGRWPAFQVGGREFNSPQDYHFATYGIGVQSPVAPQMGQSGRHYTYGDTV